MLPVFLILGIFTSSIAGAAVPSSPGTNHWIEENFDGTSVISGDFTSRQNIETPVLVQDATNTASKYAFSLLEQSAPDDRRAAFVNVSITDLSSTDAFGAGIASNNGNPNMEVFISDVYIEPNWPNWVDYATTNKDGIVLDSSLAVYAEDLHIKNWNADSAMDIKSENAQLVRLKVEGSGHRALRFWKPGDHYIVDSELTIDEGFGNAALMWFADCTTATVNIYNSTFNGSSTVPVNKIKCDTGNATNLNLVYLTIDPKTTGEMHPMFSPDNIRKAHLGKIGNALEAYHADNGTFKVSDSGYVPNNGNPATGAGWFSYECDPNSSNCRYPRSISRAILEDGYTDTEIVDPSGVTQVSISEDQSGYIVVSDANSYTLWANLENPTASDIATMDNCIHSTYDNFKQSRPEGTRFNYCVSGQ